MVVLKSTCFTVYLDEHGNSCVIFKADLYQIISKKTNGQLENHKKGSYFQPEMDLNLKKQRHS